MELRDGRLIAPFRTSDHSVETASYHLVKPAGRRNARQVELFETWLRSALASEGLLPSAAANPDGLELSIVGSNG